MDFEKLNDPDLRRTRRALQQDDLQYTYLPFMPHAAYATLGIRRSVHEAVGEFDESLLRLQDTDNCWRVQPARHPLRFVPKAAVHYRLRGTLRGVCRPAFLWSEYNVALYWNYRPHGMAHLSGSGEPTPGTACSKGAPLFLTQALAGAGFGTSAGTRAGFMVARSAGSDSRQLWT